MANRYDAAVLATNAQHLEGLARTARSNMLNRTTEKATRLGAEGERLGREARAADSQRAEADKLASTLVSEAVTYDTRAQAQDQRAAAAAARGDYAGQQEATELREDAAKAREGAAVARGKSQIATDDAKRLADESTELRVREQAIDAELADMGGRMPVTELAVDHLEWHADKARAMSDTVKQADDLQSQATAATARGDRAAAAELDRRAAVLRDDADVLAAVRERPPFPLDHSALEAIGVTVTSGDLSVPLPELIDPNSPMNPLADTSSGSSSDNAVAEAGGETGVDDPIGADATLAHASMADTSTADTPTADTPTAGAGSGDPVFADMSASADSVNVAAAGSTSFDSTSFDTAASDMTSFDTSAFDTSGFDKSSLDTASSFSFDEPATTDVGFGTSESPSFTGPDEALDPPPIDDDGGFADPGMLA